MVVWEEPEIKIQTGTWSGGKNVTVMFDSTEKHRYRLSVIWDATKPSCLFIMINPSTADALQPDKTLNRCIGFAERNGYGSLEVVNLYSYRTKDIEELWESGQLNHPENDIRVKEAVRTADNIIIAWGNDGAKNGKYLSVLKWIDEAGKTPYCLGKTARGMPKHPLYLSKETEIEVYGE
ncbi:DUF1643 domain-containing protein [Bhargavaea massiliensis]|uniref:DUF1643 domain-containing protein n=1 Tax=Bhargavaea massiliensis TaxID=2697500 RepID=UPI001BD0AF51|nr:DUF1643 domain-containing protein [Bhargavaea massiliensis]